MKRVFFNRSLLSCLTLALLLGMTSCEALQDTLSSEQKKDQVIDIGTITADSTTYYYNGKSGENVKGNEAHLVLKLGQIANATNAVVAYTLSYKMKNGSGDTIARTASGKGTGTLSDSKSKYYVDLSPAINLIDGSKDVADDDISLTLSVSGLTNASGNTYNGYSMAKFNKAISFAPLYSSEALVFSTKTTNAGATFTIPLNGKITAVDSTVTATATTGTLPATTFTAKLSADGKQILLTSSADLTGKDFTADITLTGIKPVGGKESYTYTFKGVLFKPLLVVVDGKLADTVWSDSTKSKKSTAAYASPTGYNLSALYVTNDENYLYVAVTGALALGSGDNIVLMVDNTAASGAGMSSTDSGINDYLVPSTKTTYTGVDFYLCHLQGTALHSRVWGPRTDGVEAATTGSVSVAEYKIPLSLVANAAVGNVLKLFVSTSAYTYVEGGSPKNTFALKDCIPSAAATVGNGGQSLSIDFSKALEYTVQ
ncbi:MAG: hypothetical protein IJS09_06260 [Treponema sp.]|nr:hypothetical protein [Treponema sp.]